MRFLRNKEENVSKKVWFFLAYTVCFAIIAGAVFSVFIINKKSFIWVPDGLQQHFNALLYYRSWLLSILDTLVTEHKVSVPLWDMQIGLGSDVLTTLHYYVIGDPLNLLSVFVPDEKYMELFYNTMVLVRIYLAGLAFSAYCRWTETIFYTAWSNGVRFLFLGYYCGAASVFFKSDDLPAADSGRGG